MAATARKNSPSGGERGDSPSGGERGDSEAAVVDRATLNLLGVPADAGLVSVSSVSHGFAELDFAVGPRLVALDFLPDCAPGDVLAL
jgi:hypothetical protein